LKHVNIIIRGKVQGVWFRKFTKDRADKLAICGFVKNLKDGCVFVYACGEESNLNEFINWCHTGPILAKVTEVVVEDADAIISDHFAIK